MKINLKNFPIFQTIKKQAASSFKKISAEKIQKKTGKTDINQNLKTLS